MQTGDLIEVAGHYGDLISKGTEAVGTEVDEPRARNAEIEVADIHMGKSGYAGKTLEEVGREIGSGVDLKSMFRNEEIPEISDG